MAKTKIALFIPLFSFIILIIVVFLYQKQLTQMALINENYKENVVNQNKKIGTLNTKVTELSTENKELESKINSIDIAMNFRSKRWVKIKRVRGIVKKTMIHLGKYPAKMNIIELTKYSRAVVDFSDEYDVPIPLIIAVTRQESAFNPEAVSHAGARGLMQLMPRTAKECAEDIGKTNKEKHIKNIFNIRTNVQLGTYYLRKMLTKFDEDTELAIKAYNAGPGYVSKVLAKQYNAYPAETVDYSKKVLEYLEKYEASYN